MSTKSGASSEARAGAGAGAAASVATLDVAQIPTNQFLNQKDCGKDLGEGGAVTLNERDHGKYVAPMLVDLYVPAEKQKEGLTPPVIGDTKEVMKEEVKKYLDISNKANSIEILREKHSSGNFARPEGLYVSQDNGSWGVVSNPKKISTPGNIIDPSGKTKKGVEVLSLTTYGRLHKSNIQRLGLDTVITDDIVMTEDTEAYIIRVPTEKLGNIEGIFNKKTYKAQTPYFAGNSVKNKFILEFIRNLENGKIIPNTKEYEAALIECKKYILCKELGDTFEVEWLNVLFETSGGIYTKENTVIITTDTVVLLRCIVNGVACIFTDSKGQTRFYKARTKDPNEANRIEASFILGIKQEVISHNQSVINTLQSVIDSNFPNTNREKKPVGKDGGAWINGLGWDKNKHDNCIAYLQQVVTRLTNINKDISLYFNPITNIEAAKAFASRSHFQNPFVWYQSGGFFKSIGKVKFLLETGEYRFLPILPSTFSEPKLNQGGGGQHGGARSRKIKEEEAETIKAAQDISTWEAILKIIISEKDDDKEGYTIPHSFLRSDTISPASPGYTSSSGTYDFDAFVRFTDGGNINVPFGLYTYIRFYHPEIFTYAIQVDNALQKQSLVKRGKGYESMLDRRIQTYGIEYIDENDIFILKIKGGGHDPENIRRQTLHAITISMYFVKAFPSLQTESLMDFLYFFSTSYPDALEPLDKELWDAAYGQEGELEQFLERQDGGGSVNTSLLNPILSDAMDFYEVYYTYRIRALYEDRDLTEKELDLIYGDEPSKTQASVNTTVKTLAALRNQEKTKSQSVSKVTRSLPLPKRRPPPPRQRATAGGRRFSKTRKQKRTRKAKRKTRCSSKKRI